jgi:hypothetical protein
MDTASNTSNSVADPLLEEVRALKEVVSSQFGHDVVKLCEALQREQASSGRRVIPRQRRTAAPGSANAQ